MIAQKSVTNGKANVSSSKSVFSPTKRPFDPSTFDEVDSENIDPATLNSPSKKSKNGVSDKPFKPFTFSLTPSKSMPPPPTIPSRLNTSARANMSSLRTPLTAPAGRSPKRKAAGLNKNRRVSAPFSRIDPPFGSRNASTLPFSLDAALSGTFSNAAPKSAGATIQESMPKNWFFDIYEDSPEEVAHNLLEHSTLTLDLSSDEESSRKEQDDRGKENMPPEDYDAPTASRPAAEPTVTVPKHVKKTDIIRKKIVTDEMDDGQRSPLSDLETESFIPEGLDKDSHVIVNPTPEKPSSTSATLDVNNLFDTPVPFTFGSAKKPSIKGSSSGLFDMPVVDGEGDLKGEITVWEDSPSASPTTSTTAPADDDVSRAKVAVADENTEPFIDEVA